MSAPAPVLRLDPTSALPVPEQIRTQVVDLVTSGRWPGGTRLPPVRAVPVAAPAAFSSLAMGPA